MPSAELHVVGNHPDLASGGIVGYGVLDERNPKASRRLESLFQRATCFVMPSHHEPAGIVYAEAAATGVPSIGTTSGGAGDVIGDGGLVVDPGDDSALLQAMLMIADPVTAKRLGEAALARSQILTWRTVAERLLRAFALPTRRPRRSPATCKAACAHHHRGI